MAKFGYIRVSTKEQKEDRQLIALQDCSIPPRNLYIDKQSGKDFKRPAYQKMLKRLKEGDILLVKSIDRLGRNYDEILEQWRKITKEKKADIIVLDIPLLNTTQSKDLIGTLIADLVLQLLSYVAQTEREFIRQRQAEGIRAAKIKGVKFGRPKKYVPCQFYTLKNQWCHHQISSRQAAQILNISHQTFLRWCREEQDND